MKKIGEILLDTGVLLIGDMVYLKKMKHNPHHLVRQFKQAESQKIYTQGIDFQKYSDVLWDNKTVNDLIAQKILIEIKQTNDIDLSSENILNDLDTGFKQIRFENGTNGKAFAILSDEGFYPIYAETDEKGISKLIIDLRVVQE